MWNLLCKVVVNMYHSDHTSLHSLCRTCQLLRRSDSRKSDMWWSGTVCGCGRRCNAEHRTSSEACCAGNTATNNV